MSERTNFMEYRNHRPSKYRAIKLFSYLYSLQFDLSRDFANVLSNNILTSRRYIDSNHTMSEETNQVKTEATTTNASPDNRGAETQGIAPLLLPAPSDASDAQKLDINEQVSALKFDALGPMVVNSDGVSTSVQLRSYRKSI